jgi:glycine/D-amino acid oxidase-like deaminating enzyme
MSHRSETSERIIIVGGGFAGLSIAARLAQAGLPVTVLEASTLGCEASTRNQGWLHSGAVFAREDVALARLCHAALKQTLAFAPQCIEPGHDGMYYILSRPGSFPADWTSAWDAAGIPYRPVPRDDVPLALPGISHKELQHVFELPDRAFRPDTLLCLLGAAARNAGAEVRTGIPVMRLLHDGDSVDGVVTGTGEEVHGALVILAAGTMSCGDLAGMHATTVGRQSSFTRVILKTHLVAVQPDVGRMPFCVLDRGGFNHLPHCRTSVFGSNHWYAVYDPSNLSVEPHETAPIWEEVQRYFPDLDRRTCTSIREWSGTTVQAMHADQVVPGHAPLPTVIDHRNGIPTFENLLSVYPGRATLWPQLAEQTRTIVLDRLESRPMHVARPPWGVVASC